MLRHDIEAIMQSGESSGQAFIPPMEKPTIQHTFTTPMMESEMESDEAIVPSRGAKTKVEKHVNPLPGTENTDNSQRIDNSTLSSMNFTILSGFKRKFLKPALIVLVAVGVIALASAIIRSYTADQGLKSEYAGHKSDDSSRDLPGESQRKNRNGQLYAHEQYKNGEHAGVDRGSESTQTAHEPGESPVKKSGGHLYKQILPETRASAGGQPLKRRGIEPKTAVVKKSYTVKVKKKERNSGEKDAPVQKHPIVETDDGYLR